MEVTTEPRAATAPSPTEPEPAAAPAQKPFPVRRIVLSLVVLAGLAAGGTWAWGMWTYGQAHVSTDDAQVDGHVIPVLARVGGYVDAVEVSENDAVHAGEELVVIDDTDILDRVAQADAEVAAASVAAESGTSAQVAGAQSQTSALQAQIAAARANAQRAERDLDRIRGLAAQQIVSQQQLDAAQAAATAAQANVRALESQVSAAQAGVAGARSGGAAAAARLDAARAVRQSAAQQLTYTHVDAPASGTASRVQVEPGQLVQPGQPLLTVVGDSLWITANFKETDLDRLRIGQPVEIEVDAYPGCTAHGTVESVAAATGSRFALLPPDNATGNFTKVVQRVPVRIRLTDGCGADRPLRPGFSTVVHAATAPASRG